jgi:hypothetical protein
MKKERCDQTELGTKELNFIREMFLIGKIVVT